jgi:phospholipase C
MQKRVLGQGALITLCLILFSCGGGTGTTNSFKQPNPPSSSQIPLSPIQHLIIVVMQNSSFDHLFGTFSGANGLDPNAASYRQVDQAGNTIQPQLLTDLSPPDLNHTRTSYLATYDSSKMDKYAWQNGDTSMDYFDSTSVGMAADGQQFGVGTLWNYAQQYALSDNFFAAAMASEPSNMLYMVSADPGTDPYGYPQLDACTAGLFQQNQSSGATITPPLTTQNVGDQLSANNISWGFYQEYFVNEQNGTCTQYVPQENPFQYFQTTANSANVQNFSISGFNTMLSSGTLPSVMWLQPDPLNSMHPGAGNVANAIEFLDKVVQAVKSSPEWSSTAIVVLWDESGGWYDHLPPPQLNGTLGLGARVPMIVISPYAKANYVSHQQMDFVSILRFIQWNWALGRFADSTQAAREQQSGDLCDLLTSSCGSP